MNEKIIQFPGAVPKEEIKEEEHTHILRNEETGEEVKLTQDQQKAMNIILSQTTFILIGFVPSPSGCDFYTALHGDKEVLANAKDSLIDVIGRLYAKRNI